MKDLLTVRTGCLVIELVFYNFKKGLPELLPFRCPEVSLFDGCTGFKQVSERLGHRGHKALDFIDEGLFRTFAIGLGLVEMREVTRKLRD